ncbi:MAG TPA: hypothetical protein PLC79_01375, partial [Phycisphaerae bacterium]|nr:hypothetical protein [Phycisphaerae bacterium]
MTSILDSLNPAFDLVTQWMIPLGVLLIVLYGYRKGVPLYESFVTGAKEGFNTAVMIIPYLVAILFVVGVFRASGAFDDIKHALAWGMGQVGLG